MRTGEASSSSTERAAKERAAEARRLRSFGLVVGGVLALLGLWPVLFRHEKPRLWLLGAGSALAALGAAAPRSLRHLHGAWMAAGHALGWINTRILLVAIFCGLLTPMALVRRWLGKDSMRRRFQPELDTYAVSCTPRPRTHMRQQH